MWKKKPSESLKSLLSEMDDASILTGPDRDPDEVDIDPIFAKNFDDALLDLMTDAGIRPDQECLVQDVTSEIGKWTDRLFESGDVIFEDKEAGVRIVIAQSPQEDDLGVLLLRRREGGKGGRIEGMFTGCTLCVDPLSRGMGYGRLLVMSRLLVDESLPTWDHDTPAYSPGGEATIISALYEARRVWFAPDPSPGM